jgi:AraC-like DNA-binding protein
LWLVRKRLLAGTDSVKACALAFGLWHLSDFSKSYRFHFGEPPSREAGDRSDTRGARQSDAAPRHDCRVGNDAELTTLFMPGSLI